MTSQNLNILLTSDRISQKRFVLIINDVGYEHIQIWKFEK